LGLKGEVMNEHWLLQAEDSLTKLVANILQLSHKDSSKLASALIAKTSGAAGAAGVLGLIGAFGSASTGTAIAGLSGAAASNATLFWLGSLVGGGVFAGTVLTGGIGLVAGYLGLKFWRGKPRPVESITDEEKALVDASLGLVKAFREQRESKAVVGKAEARFVLEKAWSPLVKRFVDYEAKRAVKTLNFKNLVGLGNRRRELESLTKELESWAS
jgi:hypothetical protein